MSTRSWLKATDAADILGVRPATLYAYVSRGYIRSQSMPGSSRARGYSRDDVERLRRRTEERRDPDKATARALQWGMPVLESSIALIDGVNLYYRGHDAAALARSRSLQEVASLIWTGRFDAMFQAAPLRGLARERSTRDDLPFVARAQSLLAAASARDQRAADVRPGSAAICGWQLLHLLTDAATAPHRASSAGATARQAASAKATAGQEAATIDQSLARAWAVSPRGVDVLRAALILCADHELNVSSFTARCVASAGSNLYAVVIAGLAALEGPRHGGASARVESMLASMRRTQRLRSAVAARLRRGDAIDGFGHPLYQHGDPRAAVLIQMLRERFAASAELAFTLDFAEAAGSALPEAPNIDFALAAVARVLRLPPGAPLILFAIGRTIGWIGHAVEQYAAGQLIRPRAKYVGIVPTAPLPGGAAGPPAEVRKDVRRPAARTSKS